MLACSLGMWVAVASIGCVGCDDVGGVVDAGVVDDAGTPDAGDPCPSDEFEGVACLPQAPALPAPPVLAACLDGADPTGCAALPIFSDWPCRAGFTADKGFREGSEPEGIDEFTTCTTNSVPAADDASCVLAGTMPVVGEGFCVPVGPEVCPASGSFAENLPATGVHYVREGAAGNGSEATPFGTIAEALAAANDSDVIALAAGSYSGEILIDRAIEVRGACAAEVILVGPTAANGDDATPDTVRGTVHVDDGGDLVLSGVTVTGARTGLRVVAGSLDAREVIVRASTRSGVHASGGTLRLDGVLIDDTLALADGTRGRGVQLDGGAVATFTRVSVIDNRERGVFATGTDTTLEATNLLIARTKARESDLRLGQGLRVENGADVIVNGGVLDQNRAAAVVAFAFDIGDPAPSVSLTDVVIRDTLPAEQNNEVGGGVGALDGAIVSLARVLFEGNRNTSISALTSPGFDPPSISLQDVVVRNTRAQESDSNAGHGILVGSGASLTGQRVLIDQSRTTGVVVTDTGSRVELTDAVVLDTTANEGDDTLGNGVSVVSASFTATRLLIERSRTIAMTVVGLTGAPATVTLDDVTVRDTESQLTDGFGGAGVSGTGSVDVSIDRATFQRNRDSVLVFADFQPGEAASDPGPVATLSDILVTGTRGQEVGLSGAAALDVENGATVTLSGAVFANNDDHGISVVTLPLPDAVPPTLIASDVVVRDTIAAQDGRLIGAALSVFRGGDVRLERALFLRSVGSGVHLATDADAATEPSLTLVDVTISDTQPNGVGKHGFGVTVVPGGIASLERVVIEDSRTGGLFIGTNGDTAAPVVTLTDVTIRRTLPEQDSDAQGGGIATLDAVTLTGTRVVVEESSGTAVSFDVTSPAAVRPTILLQDFRVSGATPNSGSKGRGIGIQNGADATLRRVLVEDATETGLIIFGPDEAPADDRLTVVLEDLVVRSSQSAVCGDGCTLGGDGLSIYSHTNVSLQRFNISDNLRSGLLVARDGVKLRAEDGDLLENEFGANVLIEGFDRAAAFIDVRAFDNRSLDLATVDVPLGDSETIPLPELGEP